MVRLGASACRILRNELLHSFQDKSIEDTCPGTLFILEAHTAPFGNHVIIRD